MATTMPQVSTTSSHSLDSTTGTLNGVRTSMSPPKTFADLPPELKSHILMFAALQDEAFKERNLGSEAVTEDIIGDSEVWGKSLIALGSVSKEMNELRRPFIFRRLSATSITPFWAFKIKRIALPHIRQLDLSNGTYDQLRRAFDEIQGLLDVDDLIISQESALLLTGGLGRIRDGLPSRTTGYRVLPYTYTDVTFDEDELVCGAFHLLLASCRTLTILFFDDPSCAAALLDCTTKLRSLTIKQSTLTTEGSWPSILASISGIESLAIYPDPDNLWVNNVPVIADDFLPALTLQKLVLTECKPTVQTRQFLGILSKTLNSLTLHFADGQRQLDEPTFTLEPLPSLRSLHLYNVSSSLSADILESITQNTVPPLSMMTISVSPKSDSTLPRKEMNRIYQAAVKSIRAASTTVRFVHYSRPNSRYLLSPSLAELQKSRQLQHVQLSHDTTKFLQYDAADVKAHGESTTAVNDYHFQQAVDTLSAACEFGVEWSERLKMQGWQNVNVEELRNAVKAVERLKGHMQLHYC
ncbi:hypothetical protein T439DRAFT_323144 [Meredithblackwellia eburnea MCA 4105]